MAIDDSLALTAFLPAEAPAASHAELALRALQRMVDATTRIAHFDELLPQALRIVVDVFDAKSAGYFEHPTDERIYLRFWLYDGRVYAPADLPHIDEARYGLMRRLADGFTVPDTHLGVNFRRRSAPSIVHHATATASPELHAFAVSMGWEWGLNAPLMVDGHADGAIAIFRGEAHPFSSDDIALANALCKQIALAMRMCKLAERDRELVAAREREASARAHAVELERANRAMRASIEGLARLDDLDQFLAQTLRAAIEAAGAQGGAVCLVEGDDVVTPVLIGVEGVIPRERQLREGTYRVPYSPLLKEAAASTVSSQRSWSVAPDDPMHPPGFLRFHAEQGNRALRLIPLRVGDRMLGWLGLGFREADPELGEHFSLLGVLAEQVTMAVEMLRVAAEAGQTAVERERALAAEQRAGEFASANEVLRRGVDLLSKATSSDEVLGIFLSQAVEVTRAAAGAVLRQVDGTEHAFVALYEDGHPVPLPARGDDLLVEEARRVTREDRDGMVRRILAGEAFWVPVDDTLATWAPGAYAYHTQRGHRGFWNTPYRVSAAINGYLALAFTTEHEPTPTMRETYRALANQVALAIELNRLADEARAQAVAAAVARERERAAQTRLAEFVRANEALRISSEKLVTLSDLSRYLDELLIAAAHVSAAAAGGIGVLDPDGRHVRLVSTVEDSGADGALVSIPPPQVAVPLEGDMRLVWAQIESARGYWSAAPEDPGFTDAYRAYHLARGHRTIVHVAMRLRGRTIGFLALCFRPPRLADDAQLEMIGVLAQQAALALEMTRLADENRLQAVDAAIAVEQQTAARGRAAELAKANEALRRSVDQLAQKRDLASFLEHILCEAMRMLDGAVAQIFLYDKQRNQLAASLGVDREHRIVPAPGLMGGLPISEPFAADITPAWPRLVAARRPLQWDVDRDAHEFWPGTLEWHRSMGHRGSVCVAMMMGDEPLGMLGIAFFQRDAISEAEFEFIQALGQQAALAIQYSRLAHEAEQAALVREQRTAALARAEELANANEVLSESLSRMLGEPKLDAFLDHVLVETCAHAGAHSNALFLYDKQTGALSMQRYLEDGRFVEIATTPGFDLWRAPVPPDVVDRWRASMQARKQLFHRLDDAPDRWPSAHLWHIERGLRSVLVIALGAGTSSFGLLALGYRHETEVPANEIELVQALANQASMALHLTRLADEARDAAVVREREIAAQQRAAELARANAVLRSVNARLAGEDDLDQFLLHVLDEAAGLIGATDGAVFLLDASRTHLALVNALFDGQRAEALPGHPYGHGEPVPLDRFAGWAQVAQARGQPIVANLRTFVGLPPETLAWHQARRHEYMTLSVLMLGDQPVGLMALATRRAQAIAPEQLDALEALGQQAALSVRAAHLAERVRDAALADQRNQLARDIHDSLAQSFTSIAMQTEALLSRFIVDVQLERTLQKVMRTARLGIAEARATALALRPLDNRLGAIDEALAGLAERSSIHDATRCAFASRGLPLLLPMEVQDALLRIAQEAVNNALKHSGGTHIELDLDYAPASVTLTVADDGRGVRVPSGNNGGLGMSGMRARAEALGGRFAIESRVGSHTRVVVTIPIAAEGKTV